MSLLQWALYEADLDPSTGAEQKGRRPVLIVSNDEFNQAMPNVTVLPLTSTQRRLYPSEVLLEEGKAGQRLQSIVMAHQIRTISKKRMVNYIGTLQDGRIRAQIQDAIREHMDIE